MNEVEVTQLCAFYRRSRYDVIQVHQEDAWGAAWTFAPCNPKAAEQATLMLKRMVVRRVRHFRRARLLVRPGEYVEAVVTTVLPERLQTVLQMGDGSVIYGLPYLRDECLQVIEDAFEDSRLLGNLDEHNSPNIPQTIRHIETARSNLAGAFLAVFSLETTGQGQRG